MVFSIISDAVNEKNVNPLAHTFADFLGLVLACKNANLIEQIYWQSKEQFAAFLQKDGMGATEEQNAVLAQLQTKLGITPIADPYGYVRDIQASFGYSQINYSDEYYDITGLPR